MSILQVPPGRLAKGMPLGPRLDAALFRLTQPGTPGGFAFHPINFTEMNVQERDDEQMANYARYGQR